MRVSLLAKPLGAADGDVLIVGSYADEKRLPEPLQRLDRALGGRLGEVLVAEKCQGKTGQLTHLYGDGRVAAKRLVVVGLGARGSSRRRRSGGPPRRVSAGRATSVAASSRSKFSVTPSPSASGRGP